MKKITLHTLNGSPHPHQIHLLLQEDDQPILLGEGRFAKVYLGADGDPDDLAPGDLLALKFLQKDRSPTVTANYISRFYQEVAKTHQCKKMGVQNSVAHFLAFGHVGAYSPSDLELLTEVFYRDNAAEHQPSSLFHGWSLSQASTAFEQNKLPDSWNLTGDFYAMGLCLISVEELLIAQGSPLRGSGAKAIEACEIEHAPIHRWIGEKRKAADALKIKLEEEANAFEDLAQLESLLTAANEGSEASQLRSAALFQLATSCVEQVQKLHQFQEPKVEEIGLAHRDLKPGNVLLSIEDPTRFLLSDLGFIATVLEIKHPGLSMTGSLEEGGVLPAGSRGFRAPEQIESGQDISFTVLAEPGQDSPSENRIMLPSHFGAAPEPGDWLYTKAHVDMEAPKPLYSGTQKQRMIGVESNRKGVVCTIPKNIALPTGVLLKGQIVKDVSLHSDIFALGCISYYLGSESQDPERFMQAFVDPIVQALAESQLPKWAVSSPLWMAAVLCQQKAALLRADLEYYVNNLPKTEMMDKQRHLNIILTAVAPRSSWKGLEAWARNSNEASLIRAYRQNLASNPYLQPLLIGKVSDAPISFPQLFLTLLCCMRDGEDCVVRRAVKPVDEKGQRLEVYSAVAHEFALRITNIATRLKGSPSLQVKLGRWAELGHTALEVFLAARLSSDR